MNRFGPITIIREFTNNEIPYGIYSVTFNGEDEKQDLVLIRNNNSIGTVTFLHDHPASDCVLEVRNDVKREFLTALQAQKESLN